MPVYSPPNCKVKILLTIIVTLVIIYICLHFLVNLMGLAGVFIVLSMALVLTVWSMDIIGDKLFTDEKYLPSKEKTEQLANTIIDPSKFHTNTTDSCTEIKIKSG